MRLHRYAQRLSPHILPKVLSGADMPHVQEVGEAPGLAQVAKRWKEIASEGPIPARHDAELARELHGALRDTDKRVLLDQRFWQWLTTGPFADYTQARWVPGLAEQPHLLDELAVQKRYLGGGSLNGMSRNALSRLFWGAETLWTPGDQYRWSDVVVGNQDFYTALFERRLGLYPALAVVVAENLENAAESERRETLMNLNHVMTTVVVEALRPAQLTELVESCRP